MKTSSKKWQKIRKIKGLRQFVTWYPRHVSENPGSKDIQKAYLVSNMKRENDGVYLRVISDHAPEGAKIVEPQLEEVFLSIFKKESDIHENTIL